MPQSLPDGDGAAMRITNLTAEMKSGLGLVNAQGLYPP